MKKYNIKRLVKIKLNIVGADASVRLRKDQNENNIKIFEKFKSNAVGVGVPDDPNAKNKHINKPMSNIPTSNIKNPTSNAAITLIALIITIIVLLILAGVTLNMVMGKNGIFGKANNAKNKSEVAQYEEELRMCVLELQTDAAANGTTFNMDTIKNKLVEKVKELENTTEIEFPTKESETRIDGTYKGYEFYIDDKYVAHIGDKSTGISLTTSLEPTGWTQGPVTATITIKSNNGLSKIVPEGEAEISLNGDKEYIITKNNIEENTTFTYEVTDSQGNTQTKIAVINTIDKNPPVNFTITAENTEEGLKITGEATDAESGIDHYEYFVKDESNKENKYDTNTIKGLSTGKYTIYVIAYDKAGNNTKSEETQIEITIIIDKLESGGNYYLAIDTEGNLWSEGYNYYGALGTGKTPNDGIIYNWTQIMPGTKFKEISCSSMSSNYALDVNGKLYSWGNNYWGQLGTGDKEDKNIPQEIKKEIVFKKIATCNGKYNGNQQMAAIDENDNLWIWGSDLKTNINGENIEQSYTPIKISDNLKIKNISVGDRYYIAIDENDDILTWGNENDGELGRNTTVDNYNVPTKIETNKKFKKVAAGDDTSYAIDTDGNLYSWGRNWNGLLGINNSEDNYRTKEFQKINLTAKAVEIKIYDGNSGIATCLDENGNVYVWGNAIFHGATEIKRSPSKVDIPEKIKSIAIGQRMICTDTKNNTWVAGHKTASGWVPAKQTTNLFYW